MPMTHSQLSASKSLDCVSSTLLVCFILVDCSLSAHFIKAYELNNFIRPVSTAVLPYAFLIVLDVGL